MTATLVLIAGCSGSTPAGHDPTTHRPATSSTAFRPRPTPTTAQSRLHVVTWGVDDGLLSVLVQNTGTQEIRSARAVITARDQRGTIIATVSGPSGSLCCTVVGLRPHATFGLYADFGAAVSRTRDVEVDYSAVDAAPARDGGATISSSDARIADKRGVTVVTARLSAGSAAGPYVAVQAVLTGASGRLAAVISGRFYCLFPGDHLGIALQLFHPVPAGTVVRQVSATTIPPNLTTVTTGLPSCTTT